MEESYSITMEIAHSDNIQLITDRERQIVTHMCLRLTDKYTANIDREFIRSKFYRFITLINDDLEMLYNELSGSILYKGQSTVNNHEVLFIMQLILKLKSTLINQMSNSILQANEKRTFEFFEAQIFQYDVPGIFLNTYGFARLLDMPIELGKYISVMPELEQLLEV